jgi:hypothetical protein
MHCVGGFEVALPPITDISQRGTVRLIPSARLRPPVLAPLAPNQDFLRDLSDLEGATSGRLQSQARGQVGLSAHELVYGVPMHTFINAAFTYTRPGGNRFNDENRGAWYAGFDVETSLREVSYHLSKALKAVGRFENQTDYAELRADFIGPFFDVRDEEGPAAYLSEDTIVAYPAGQLLARSILRAGGNGIIYPSVRHNRGICIAAFRPHVVQNVRQGALWRLKWTGDPDPNFEIVS